MPTVKILPKVSLFDRFQGAFVGAAILGNSESFPWEVLEAIALNYERPEYRYSDPHRHQLRHWSPEQWRLAEVLWQSLDQPPFVGSGSLWLGRVLAGWQSLMPTPDNTQTLDTGKTAKQLIESRATLPQWRLWLGQFDAASTAVISATETGETALLKEQEFWTIVGGLGRTGGEMSTAIAQTTMLLNDESSSLGWIGASLGLTHGAERFLSNFSADYLDHKNQNFLQRSALNTSKIYDIVENERLSSSVDAARNRAIQCFNQWSGAAPFTSPSLTPWTVTLSR